MAFEHHHYQTPSSIHHLPHPTSRINPNLAIPPNINIPNLLLLRLASIRKPPPHPLILHAPSRVGSRKQHIELLKRLARRLWAAEPDICGSEEAADQWPDEDLWADGVDARAAAEDHDPG